MLLVLPYMVSCRKYLDIVPDNVPTLDNAFTMRKEAEKYLFTCYSYLPKSGSSTDNPAFYAGDEVSLIWPFGVAALQPAAYRIPRGGQNVVNPYSNFWDGVNQAQPLYRGLRDCNIFLDNIGKVPDMSADEKKRWIAEVKFLKAYYHFYLVRLYGPVPLAKTNQPVDAEPSAVKVYRSPVDSCFNYIVGLIDEAKDDLPTLLSNETDELGRITKPIALAIKARILVTAASPLFNGNGDYTTYVDNRGVKLFNTTKDNNKWVLAVNACKEAIDLCHEVGLKLYTYKQDIAQYTLAPETITQMSIRNAVAQKWNTEIIWGNTNSMAGDLQTKCFPRGIDVSVSDNTTPQGQIAPPLKIVEMFYSKNGVPISEDKTWNYANRYSILRTAVASEKYNLEPGYTTSYLHFDRENRFYACLGFDGGKWYGQGKYDDNSIFTIKAKKAQPASQVVQASYSTTGYWVKKLVHFQNAITSTSYTTQTYPWPEMRLADLYLLYSEALNEKDGPTAETLKWINLVRARAGLTTVEDSWTNYSTNPSAYQGKDGFRQIIHRERLIELAFEGSRFYDVRRWKEAMELFNQSISGWDISQPTEAAYYRPKLIFNQVFTLKDYFWPIRESNTNINRNLVQSPGW